MSFLSAETGGLDSVDQAIAEEVIKERIADEKDDKERKAAKESRTAHKTHWAQKERKAAQLKGHPKTAASQDRRRAVGNGGDHRNGRVLRAKPLAGGGLGRNGSIANPSRAISLDPDRKHLIKLLSQKGNIIPGIPDKGADVIVGIITVVLGVLGLSAIASIAVQLAQAF